MLSSILLAGAAYTFMAGCLHPPVRDNAKHGAPDYKQPPILTATPDPASHDIALLGNLEFGLSSSDVWGYAADGREYAIIGLWDRAVVVDVTDPAAPVEITHFPGVFSLWRDMKVYGHHLYIGVDGLPQGIQIVDLSPLPDEPVLVNTMLDVLTSHNLYIDTDRGLLYACGHLYPTNEGMRIYSLADPVNPELLSVWDETYVHDVHAVGDRAIGFLGPVGVAVFDVSDPSQPTVIQEFTYPQLGYAHSGWLSPDGKYLAVNDEFDELFGIVSKTRIRFFEHDAETDTYAMISEYIGPNGAPDHNVFWKGDYCYIANYTYGLTILDMSVVEAPLLVAKYDTFHPNNDSILAGAWGVYPFLPSGNILISDINTGLYVFEHVPGRDDLLAFHLREYGFDPLDPNAFAPLPVLDSWHAAFFCLLLCMLGWGTLRSSGNHVRTRSTKGPDA